MSSSKRGKRWWVAPILGSILAVAALGAGGALFWQHLRDQEMAREGRTVVEAIRKVAKLTTVEMNVSSFQLRKDAKNLLGFIPIKCEKTVAVFYRGKVAAGFDLDEPTAITVTTAAPGARRRLLVELPEPRLLYTDAPAPEIVVANGSVCNQLEPADYQALSGEARLALQKEAVASGILRQADQHARELIAAVAGPLGFETEVRVKTSALSIGRMER